MKKDDISGLLFFILEKLGYAFDSGKEGIAKFVDWIKFKAGELFKKKEVDPDILIDEDATESEMQLEDLDPNEDSDGESVEDIEVVARNLTIVPTGVKGIFNLIKSKLS